MIIPVIVRWVITLVFLLLAFRELWDLGMVWTFGLLLMLTLTNELRSLLDRWEGTP